MNDEKEETKGALQNSIKRLNLDNIDLYLIHWPIGKTENGKLIKQVPLHETWKKLEDCVEKGLTRSIGLSIFNVQIILDLLPYAKIKPACKVVELHPYLTKNGLVNFCKMFDIKIIAFNATAKGIYARIQKIMKNMILTRINLSKLGAKI